jgi:hypothetical protein
MTNSSQLQFQKNVKQYQKSPMQKERPTATGSRRLIPRMPWILLLTIAGLFLSLKALMLVRIGEHEYRAKLASYVDPDLAHRVAIAVLEPDVISLRLHDLATPYLVRSDCRDITKRPRPGKTQPLC